MQVEAKRPADEDEAKKSAKVEVLVDLLLDSEGLTKDKGLVYVMENLDGYPVSAGEDQHAVVH